MAKLTLLESLDFASLDLSFPLGGTATSFGFRLLSDTGWRINVTLEANDIATKFRLFSGGENAYSEVLRVTDINRPVVAPIGGTIQSLLSLVLDGNDTLTGTRGNDGMAGYKGNDVLFGSNGKDILFGGQGADLLDGGRKRDILRGGNGRDDLDGGLGDDVLIGGKGDDRMEGGSGNDRLVGGPGSDTFVFREYRRGSNNDKVKDFEVGVDNIEIGRGANKLAHLNFTQEGDDVLMSFKNVTNVTVKFLDVSVAELSDDSNFIFV